MPNNFDPMPIKHARSRSMLLRVTMFVGAITFIGTTAAIVAKKWNEAPKCQVAMSALRGALPRPLDHEWRLVRGKHWQIISSPSESVSATDEIEKNRGSCAAGMVHVQGKMKMDPLPNMTYGDARSIEEMQKTTCIKWINRDYPERCAEFDRTKWLQISKEFPTQTMNYCIDRFEYPNHKGEYPIIMASYYEAANLCEEQGKRLCDELEWTFACEGEEATPYPYGYVRNPNSCVVDQKWRAFSESAMRPRDGISAMAEMDRLWQGVTSGSQPECRSPFGVYDLTGNVDEWTSSVHRGERPSILKGGYWGPVRTRCRPSTRSHDENHIFYQQGFRCCSAVGAVTKSMESSRDPSTLRRPTELK